MRSGPIDVIRRISRGRRVLAAFLLTLIAGTALAQDFPSRPITLKCPCPRDPGTERYAATIAKLASKNLAQPVIAEEARPGRMLDELGSVAKATPDGHTLSVLLISAFRQPHMQGVSWDPSRELTFVIGLARGTIGVVVRSDSTFKTLGDLIAYAKANPGSLKYGAYLRGTTPHLAMEELGIKTGARLLHVPGSYEEISSALLRGQVMAIADGPAWAPQVDSGAFRLLVTFGEQRSRWNAPTARELGFDVLSYGPLGIVGPKGMNAKVTRILHDAFNRALDDLEYAAILKEREMVDWYKSSEDYAEWAVDQFKFQRGLIERTIGLGRN